VLFAQIKNFPLRKIRNRRSLVLHITGNLERYNGAGQQAITLAKNMDFCTSVMAFFSGGTEFSAGEMDGLRFLRVPGQTEIHKHFYAFVTLLCLRPRVLHIHGFAIGREFIPLAKLLGIKIVLKSTLMGIDDLKNISESRRINKFFLRMVDINNALSSPMARINRETINKDNVVIIPNMVLCPSLPPSRQEKCNQALVVGAVRERKGTHIALEFFIKNFANKPEAKLLIIGPYGENVDNEYYKKCLAAIPEEHLSKIEFFGQLTHNSVLECYRTSKVLMLFSEAEGMPNAVIEAMAYNCIPIVTPIGGIMKDIISNPSEGIILESLDTKVDWNKIDKLLDGEKSYERARSTFDAPIVSNRYREIYEL